MVAHGNEADPGFKRRSGWRYGRFTYMPTTVKYRNHPDTATRITTGNCVFFFGHRCISCGSACRLARGTGFACFPPPEDKTKLPQQREISRAIEVFGEPSRLVAADHRKGWRSTSGTRIGEPAIRNRVCNEGHGSVIFIPLEDKSAVPVRTPRTQMCGVDHNLTRRRVIRASKQSRIWGHKPVILQPHNGAEFAGQVPDPRQWSEPAFDTPREPYG